MASQAQVRILHTMLTQEIRALSAITGRLLQHKIANSGGDTYIEAMIDEAANRVAKGQAELASLIDQLRQRMD